MAFADMYRRQLLEEQSPDAAMAGDDSMPQAPQPASLDGILRLAAVQKGLPPALLKQIQPMIQQRIQSMTAPSAPAARPPASQPSDAPGGVPAPAAAAPKAIPGGYNELDLQKMLADQGKHADEADAIANEYAKRGDELNLAPLAGLVDSWTGSKLSQGYTPPPTRDERLATLAALKDKATTQRQKMTSDLIQLTKAGSTADSSQFRTLAGLMGQSIGAKERQDASMARYDRKDLDDQEKRLAHDLDPNQGRNGEFGKLGGQRRRVNALLALQQRRPDMNFDKREMEDLGEGLLAVIKGGNVAAEQAVRRLLPSSFKGSYQGLVEWLTNDPKGLEQQAFVKRIYGDVLSESENIDSQIAQTMQARLPQFYRLKAGRPDRYQAIVDGYQGWLKGMDGLKSQVKTNMKDEGAAAPAAASAGTIRMQGVDPRDGKTKILEVPLENQKEAEKTGFKVVK